MDGKDRETWLEVATAVYLATTDGSACAGFRGLCAQAIERHAATGRLGPDAWPKAASEAMRHQSGGAASDKGASRVRAILSGLAVASGDVSSVPVADRAELAAIVRRMHHLPGAAALADTVLAAPVPPAPAPLAAPAVVEAAYPCFSGGGAGTPWLGRRGVAVAAVDPSDAPVACRLRTAAGNDLNLRVYAGEWFRPVLAPGSWEPLDLAGFAEAAKGGSPWVDSPFVPGDVLGRASASVLDCALDVRVSTPARRTVVEATADLAARRHGRFLAVDGVVYRKAGAPALSVTCDGALSPDRRRNGLVVAWTLGDGLTATADVRTLSRTRTAALPFRIAYGTRGDKVCVAHLWDAGTFALADAAHAREFAGMLAALGPTCGPTSPYVVDASRVDAFAVEVVDPDLLPPPSPHPWLDATAALLRDLDLAGRGHCLRYEGVGPDAVPRAVLDMVGEALAGRAALAEACDALSDAVDRLVPTDPAVDTARLMACVCGRAVDELRDLYEPGLANFRA